MVDPGLATLVLATAFAPPLLYLFFLRNAERYGREPWSRILIVFLYGAVISILFAVALERVFDIQAQRIYDTDSVALPQMLLLAVVAAPMIEEFTKGLGVRAGKGEIEEVEDGIVYGVAAGLGFSATENLFYGLAAVSSGGQEGFVATIIIRSLSSSFLHATASGIVGYGLARRWVDNISGIEVLSYYAIAVLLHGFFNLLASAALGVASGLLVLVSFVSIRWTYHRIRRMDAASGPPSEAR